MDNLKAVWASELSILKEVDKICKKHCINYYADSGTLLGAIRHKGFIPWDDDVDITMLREDFVRFRKIAKKELSEPFFCQSGYNDKGFYGGMLHIRMNGTTAILTKNYPYAQYHQGIFIDIFPLDGVIENKILFKFQTFCKKLLNLIMGYKNNRKQIGLSINSIVLFLPTLLPQKMLFSMFESVCSWKKAKSAKYLDLVSYFGLAGKRLRSSYETIEQVEFADTKIPIPQGYDDVLTSLYGADYMTPKQSPTDHGECFFDTEHSYKDYLSGKLKMPEEYLVHCQNQ